MIECMYHYRDIIFAGVSFNSGYIITDLHGKSLDETSKLRDCGVEDEQMVFIKMKGMVCKVTHLVHRYDKSVCIFSVVPDEDSGFLCCECCNQFWVLTAVFLVIAISGIISISVLRAFSRKQPNDVGSC